MSITTAWLALQGELATALGSMPTNWPNGPDNKPTDGSKWAEVFKLDNVPSVDTMGSAGKDRVDGIVQVNLHYPLRTGDTAAHADFEAIRTQFPAGSTCTNAGQIVHIENCGDGPKLDSAQDFAIPVTIVWWANISR